MTYDSRFLLGILHECRTKIHELRLLAKAVPHKRPQICFLIEQLTRTALEVEELRGRVEP